METKRLPLAFHETFPLRRSAVTQVVNVLSSESDETILSSKGKREQLIRDNTHLGNNYVKSMPLYARGVGLLDGEYKATLFGKYALSQDSTLSLPDTLWIMHYHMCAPNGPGPSFWHYLVGEYFRSGNQVPKTEFARAIEAFFWETEHKALSEKSTRSTATIFATTYTNSDGFGALGILQDDNPLVSVGHPVPPTVWAFACCLISHWEACWPGRLSVNLGELMESRGLASLFLMNEVSLNSVLNELQRAGIVDVYRAERPHQLLLLSHDKEMVLRNLYGVH